MAINKNYKTAERILNILLSAKNYKEIHKVMRYPSIETLRKDGNEALVIGSNPYNEKLPIDTLQALDNMTKIGNELLSIADALEEEQHA